MQKLILSTIFVAAVLLFNSCSIGWSRLDMLNMGTSKATYHRLEQILETIESQDREALKALFSSKALSEAEDIEGGIDYLFGLIRGEIESCEHGAWSSFESIDYGKRTESIESWHTVITDVGEYKFFLLDYSTDTVNTDNVGLYALRAIKAEDEATQFAYSKYMAIPGIYVPTFP